MHMGRWNHMKTKPKRYAATKKPWMLGYSLEAIVWALHTVGTTDESPKPHLSCSSSRFVNAQVNQILSGLWVSWKFGSNGYGRSKTHPIAILIHQELTQNILVPQFHILMGGLSSATAILRGAQGTVPPLSACSPQSRKQILLVCIVCINTSLLGNSCLSTIVKQQKYIHQLTLNPQYDASNTI